MRRERLKEIEMQKLNNYITINVGTCRHLIDNTNEDATRLKNQLVHFMY